VSTANHYWLDGIAGAALVLAALWLTRPGHGLLRTAPPIPL
jgi:hypothetical protein